MGITLLCFSWSAARAAEEGVLRIIVFGAHPDDCEIKAGGVAALWAAKGHKVKFVSVTCGDIGHATEAGEPLAKRRTAEVQRANKILGIETEVLDIHDGELMPTLEKHVAGDQGGRRAGLPPPLAAWAIFGICVLFIFASIPSI